MQRLNNQKIAFLGSSITYGFAAGGWSFVDALAEEDGVIATKSAVNGTTLADIGPDSYVARLQRDFTAASYDAFVCQLSTNDGHAGCRLGTIEADDFDVQTTIGAIQTICETVQYRFHCPMIWFTCVQPNDRDYARLVQILYQLQHRWRFTIIDLWGDQLLAEQTTNTPESMADAIHPTRLGYQKLWLPVFRRALTTLWK
jgi:lysophospholipase L1-like esterase